MEEKKYGLVPSSKLSVSPNSYLSREQIYGVPEADYSGETLMQTAERYSNAFWASAYETIMSSKVAVTAYQSLEEMAEDVGMFVRGEEKDPNFNPFKHIDGYEEDALYFRDCDTIGDVNRVKKRIIARNRNMEAMSKVPAVVNFINNMLTGFLDPINLIPVGGQALKAKGFVKGALSSAAVAAPSVAIQELVIKEMSYGYSDEEYQQNVLIGTVFGSAIGGVVGGLNKVKDVSYRDQIKNQIDIVRKNTFDDKFQAEKGDSIDKFNKKTTDEKLEVFALDDARSIGAAVVPRKGMDTAAEVKGNKVVDAILSAERKWNPVARLSTSISKGARRLANSLFELPYYTKNIQDAFNIESLNKQVNAELSFLNNELTNNYSKYYFDKEDVGFKEQVMLLNPFDKSKKGKMTVREFNEGVWDYIRHGKNADNKYIVDSANKWKKIANIQRERINNLNEIGVLDVKAVDENWMPLQFNKDMIVTNTDDFVDAISQKMKSYSEELRKSGEVEFKQKEIENIDNNIKKYEEENIEIRGDIKELNTSLYYLKRNISSLEGRKHQAEKDIDRLYRSADKTKHRAYIASSKTYVKGADSRDFARQIKYGLKELTPISMGDGIKRNKILIDDPNNLLGKDSGFSKQNFKPKGRDKISDYEIITLDDLGEKLFEEGWYKERPYVDEVVSDLLDDELGWGKKYAPEDTKYLQRQAEIDDIREELSRRGFDYKSMSPAQIDNVLSSLGDTKYINKQYVEKVKAEVYSKASAEQKAQINKQKEELDFINEQLNKNRQELNKIEDDLRAKRTLRDFNKEKIAEGKRTKSRYETDLKWQEPLSRMEDSDFKFHAQTFADEVLGVKSNIGSFDDIRIDDRGSLLHRDFLSGDISMIEPFLDKDISHLISSLRKEMIDLNLMEKFGSVRLDEQIESINRDYGFERNRLLEQRKREPENADIINKKIAILDKERKKDIEAIEYAVDTMRGTEYAKHKRGELTQTVSEAAKLYNIMTSLGKVTISSIPDLAGVVLKTSIKDAIPALNVLKKTFNTNLVKSLQEVPELSHAIIELHSNFRELNAAEMMSNPYNSKLIKKSKGWVDVFMHVNLMSRWNALIKSTAGMAFMNKAYRIGDDLINGRALSEADTDWLKLYGFNEDEIKSVFANMGKHGDVSGAQKYANSAMWEDKTLAKKFQLGIGKIMDTAVVTPGAEKAKAFHDPLFSAILQYKSFIMSSTTRTLVPALQNARDFNTACGVMFAGSLGMLSVAAKDALNGKTDRTPGDFILSGFAQSGIYGWAELPWDLINGATRGGLDRILYAASGGYLGQESMSPIESSRILQGFLGPSASKITNLYSFIGDVSSGKISKSSMYKLKSLIPFQNTIYLDYILRKTLEGWSE